MKTCRNCNKEINDEAKFCRYCGSPATDAPNAATGGQQCPKCLKTVAASAKFCNYCGHPLQQDAGAVSAGDESISFKHGYITWHVLPGQLAVKIDEADIAAYGRVRGLCVAPGTRALLFTEGRFTASLESGKYPFRDVEELPKKENEAPEKNRIFRFFRNVANFVANGVSNLVSTITNDRRYTVVLVKGSEFPLIYQVDEVPTKHIRCTVGAHLLCKIDNLNGFFDAMMGDRKFITLESFAESLKPTVESSIRRSLVGVAIENISYSAGAAQIIFTELQKMITDIYPFIAVTKIIDLTADQAELENIRRLQEELYISEQELEQVHRRNEFLNRMQDEDNANELHRARTRVDFEALMNRINRDERMNREEQERFVLMLEAERRLLEARTDADTENALDQLEQSRMLSNEELDRVRRAINHRATMERIGQTHEETMAELKNDQAIDWAVLQNSQMIAMSTLQSEEAIDRERLNWEIEIGNKRFENQMARQQREDEYADHRRDIDYDFKKRKMADKMELLRQINGMKEEQTNSEHRRNLELMETEHRFEMDERKMHLDERSMILNADLKKNEIYATMTAEQIMAANPNISPAAAQALSERYRAIALAEQNSRTEELSRQYYDDLKSILAQQMDLTRDVIGANKKANEDLLAAKQEELNRVHADSERHQDRFVDGMKTTIGSVAAAAGNFQAAAAQMPAVVNNTTTVFCPNCGKSNAAGSVACSECGKTI